MQIQRFEELPTFDLAERRWTYTRTKPDSAATIDNSDDGYPEARRCHGTVQVKIVEILEIVKIVELVEIVEIVELVEMVEIAKIMKIVEIF